MENDADTKETPFQEMAIEAIARNLNRYDHVTISNYLSPPMRQKVIEYINAGGIVGTTNINSLTVLALLNKDTNYIGRKLLALIEPSQGMTSEEIAQLIDTLVQCITDANATLQLLNLYYYYDNRSVTIMPSSFGNICRMRSLLFLSVGDLQILLTQFVQITVEVATLKLIEARRVKINDDLGVLESTCGRFYFQEIYYECTDASEELIHLEMKTDISDLIPANKLPLQCLFVLELNKIAQLEMLGKLSHVTTLMVYVAWNFDAEELTDDRLPSWSRLTYIDIIGTERAHCGLYLRRLLEKYGSRLEVLIMRRFGPESNLTYELLFEWCPNLFALEITRCFIGGWAPIGPLRQLLILVVTQSARCRPIKIASFLFAPQLVHLTLHLADVDPSDLDNVSQLLMTNPDVRLLPSLRHLHVQPLTHDVHQNIDDDSVAGALRRIDRLRDVLQTISDV